MTHKTTLSRGKGVGGGGGGNMVVCLFTSNFVHNFSCSFISPQIYCCLGALSIADSLQHVNADMLGWWLCERQLPSGGLNGEKLN